MLWAQLAAPHLEHLAEERLGLRRPALTLGQLRHFKHAEECVGVFLTQRAAPNVTRTLAKLRAAGFVVMKPRGRRKAPVATVRRIVVEIDPYSERDQLEVA